MSKEFMRADRDRWQAMANDLKTQNKRLRGERDLLCQVLERGGIDSSAILASQDDGGLWLDENKRLRGLLDRTYELANHNSVDCYKCAEVAALQEES